MLLKIMMFSSISMLAAAVPSIVLAQQMTPQEMEEWLFDDSDSLVDEVNEGELVFLSEPPKKRVHHHYNKLLVTESSIDDGWVQIEQCHSNLDPVGLAQIVFREDRVRKLAVGRVKNIGKAWIEGPTVQLEDIKHDALLCITAETRSFVYNGDGTYSLHSGPYMRRFLDGYYPMHVTLDVTLAAPRLRYYETTPASQTGFKIWRSKRAVHYDAWFEGRLSTEIRFHDLVIENVDADKLGRNKLVDLKAKQ